MGGTEGEVRRWGWLLPFPVVDWCYDRRVLSGEVSCWDWELSGNGAGVEPSAVPLDSCPELFHSFLSFDGVLLGLPALGLCVCPNAVAFLAAKEEIVDWLEVDADALA